MFGPVLFYLLPTFLLASNFFVAPKTEELLRDLNLSGTVITLLQKLSQTNLRPLFQAAVPIAFNFSSPVNDRREALLYLEVKHGIKVTKENKSLMEMATSADVAREQIVNGYFKENRKKGTEFVEKSFTMFVTDEYIDGKMLDRARLMKFLVDKYEKYMDKGE